MSLKRRLEKLEQVKGSCYPPGPFQTWSDEDLARYLAEALWQDPDGAAKLMAMNQDELEATFKGWA